MNKFYITRTIEKQLLERIKEFPVLVLTGPRQSGKSTMLKRIFPDYTYVTLDFPQFQMLANNDPELFLEQYSQKVIIDEIQYAPGLLNYIKAKIDQERVNGRFILTGSQPFVLMQGITESLAGRVAVYELLGFSYEELPDEYKSERLHNCFDILFRGFFPEPSVHGVDVNTFYGSYVQTYLERDLRHVKAVHDLKVFQSFLELLAVRMGCLLNLNEVAKECGISNTTAKNWLSLLENARIIYMLRSYSKNISKRVIKSSKLYFTDTGLVSFLLRYPSSDILANSPSSGNLFENFVVMELVKYKLNTNVRWDIYFYRDSHHHEVDVVVDLGYKKILFEIKKTKTPNQYQWKSLDKLCEDILADQAYLVSASVDELKVTPKVSLVNFSKVTEVIK